MEVEAQGASARQETSASSSSLESMSSPEVKGVRRVIDDIPVRLYAVAVIGFWERFTFWGLTAPWQNYMENARHRKTGAPGALDLGQAMATRIYCAFYVFYYITPLMFAIISDTRLGRFNTLCISIILYVLGCGVMVLSSTDPLLDAGFGLPGLVIAMTLVGLGGGGFKMLMVPFIADQYTSTDPKIMTLKSGERVITDRALTLQYIYNFYYWVGNVGSLSWFATTLLENYFSFTIAYAITFASMIIAMLMLFFGARWYVKTPHEGNVLPTAVKILASAAQNGCKMAHAHPQYQLEHKGKTVAWSSQLVDELCRGLRACRVLIAFVVFYTCFDQMQNNLVSQAKQMETHGIPNDMIPGLNQVACIIIGPIIQYGLYPYLSRRRIPFKPIARITVGFGFIALSMLYAMIVQHMVYAAPPCYKSPGECRTIASSNHWRGPNHVNVWIQSPVYVFVAIGEIFAYVTALEYAYDHSPKDMKAIVQAISLVIAGIGSAGAMGLTPLARDPHLVNLYGGLFGAMTVTTALFWWMFHKYDKLYAPNDDAMVEMGAYSENDDTLTHNRGASVLRLRPRTARGGVTVHIGSQDRDPQKSVTTTVTASGGSSTQAVRRRNTISSPTERISVIADTNVEVGSKLFENTTEDDMDTRVQHHSIASAADSQTASQIERLDRHHTVTEGPQDRSGDISTNVSQGRRSENRFRGTRRAPRPETPDSQLGPIPSARTIPRTI